MKKTQGKKSDKKAPLKKTKKSDRLSVTDLLQEELRFVKTMLQMSEEEKQSLVIQLAQKELDEQRRNLGDMKVRHRQNLHAMARETDELKVRLGYPLDKKLKYDKITGVINE